MRSKIIFPALFCLAVALHGAEPSKAKSPTGDGEYHFHLGMNHYTGLGGKPNYAEAARQFQLAATAGHARAQGQLGICLLKGRGVPRNHDLAVRWLTRAADKKDAIALYTLGNFHATAKDYVKANKYYLEASARGHAAAMNNLGTSHEHGYGVPANAKKAAEWYDNAARMSLAAAQCNLALMHSIGRGVPKNTERALKLYRDAAAQGDLRAQFLLGAALHFGTLGKPDRVEAAKWLQLAAHQGHAAARAHLAAVNNKLSLDQLKTVDKQVSTFMAGVTRSENGAIGTGFFVTNNGYLLTTHHLIAQAKSIEVRLRGVYHIAHLISADPLNDIAMLKIEADTPALPVMAGRILHVGLPVFTLGLPPRANANAGPKYSHGRVVSLSGLRNDPRHVQVNLNAPPSYSGAALVDASGQAVGMVTFRLADLKAYRATGTLPRAANYVLKAARIRDFLKTIPIIQSRLPRPNQPLPNEDAGATAEAATVQILVQ